MKQSLRPLVLLAAGAVAGAVLGIIAYTQFFSSSGGPGIAGDSAGGEKQPLYWVAPMDPNYRRDKPGKSPMGMDLVPVYEEAETQDSPGVVSISPQVESNIGVRVAKVLREPFETKIRTVGYVQYDENKLVHIHPRVSGWVEVLNVKAAGDPVVKGQPLYQIYSPELVNAQEEYLSALERNSQRLIQAAEDRLNALQVSAETVAALKKNRRVQQTVTTYSPQDGVIDNLMVREGFFVKPDTTMMSIGNLDAVWVQAEVFERQAALVTAGAPVTMTLDYLPGREWSGEVDYVYPTLDPLTRTVKVRMRFANPQRELKPNMFAQISIHNVDREPTLVIPRSALIRTAALDRVVLALGDGRFKSVAVKTGRVTDKQAEVLQGLREGDDVVVSAQFLLDSESNINSDLVRMQHDGDIPGKTTSDDGATSGTDVSTVWVRGDVKQVMADHRMVNLTHEPIPEWQWPVMTMNFGVANDVDIDTIETGATYYFEIVKTERGEYKVINIQESRP